jgi:hypothetical protein
MVGELAFHLSTVHNEHPFDLETFVSDTIVLAHQIAFLNRIDYAARGQADLDARTILSIVRFDLTVALALPSVESSPQATPSCPLILKGRLVQQNHPHLPLLEVSSKSDNSRLKKLLPIIRKRPHHHSPCRHLLIDMRPLKLRTLPYHNPTAPALHLQQLPCLTRTLNNLQQLSPIHSPLQPVSATILSSPIARMTRVR